MGSDIDRGRYEGEMLARPSHRDDEIDTHPSLEEANTVARVKDLFYRARDHRRQIVAQWYRNYAILRNRTWNPSTRQAWMPSPEVPEIYPIIATLVGWSTDTQPEFDVVPVAEPYSEWAQFYGQLAQDLDTVLDANWQIESYDAEVEIVAWDALVYGIGILKSTWDDNLHQGLGNALLRRVDPFTFYPDPKARSMHDANYFIEARTMSLQDVERRWPGSINAMRQVGYTEEHDESPTLADVHHVRPSLPMANPGAIAPNTSPVYGLPGQSGRDRASIVDDDAGVTILEAWLRTPAHKNGKTYDTWRCIIVGGPCILADYMADELWSADTHPYSRYVLHDVGEFFGFSMVELLIPSQLSINRLLAAIEQNIWLMGNPVFKESPGQQRTRITNRPGTRIPISSPTAVAEWLNPPQMHPTMSADLIRFYIEEMERVSGLMAMGRGSSPGGRNAQDVLNSIQEAGFTRVRLGMRGLERTLRDAGGKIAALVTEFYDAPRMIAMVGENGQRTSLALQGKHFYVPTNKGRVPLRFQLLVQAGSSLPTSRQARIQEADVLFGMGGIDREALLEAHNTPNRQQIVARMREMEAMQGTLGMQPGQRQATRPTS